MATQEKTKQVADLMEGLEQARKKTDVLENQLRIHRRFANDPAHQTMGPVSERRVVSEQEREREREREREILPLPL
jgi:hypothetical protein